jgi:hypothetical protein
MVPKGYKEVSEGVYESDAFITSRPKIDSARIRQILNEQRPAVGSTADANTGTSIWESEHSVQQSNEHSGA